MKKIFALLCVAVFAAGCTNDDGGPSQLVFKVGGENYPVFEYGESVDFPLVKNSLAEDVTYSAPSGWTVAVLDGKITVTAPASNSGGNECRGQLTITANGPKGSATHSMDVVAGDFDVFTFEKVPSVYLASDAYGANLYTSDPVDPNQYKSYCDTGAGSDGTTLTVGVNESYGSYDFWNGGIAISRFNNMTDASYLNQCSVYFSYPGKGGGHRGSNTFAVHNGYDAEYSQGSSMYFADAGDARVIDHIFVNNATYVYLTMANGGGFGAKKFSYEDGDFLQVTVTGYDISGSPVAAPPVVFHLADFRTAESPGIIKEWTRVDLASLGAVHKLKFDMSGSDMGEYGMNTPAYFCFDDVAVVKAD